MEAKKELQPTWYRVHAFNATIVSFGLDSHHAFVEAAKHPTLELLEVNLQDIVGQGILDFSIRVEPLSEEEVRYRDKIDRHQGIYGSVIVESLREDNPLLPITHKTLQVKGQATLPFS